MEIEVGPHTYRAVEAGPADGELVLLLHGFPQSKAEWKHQLAALGEAGYHAVAPDQRGYSPGARPSSVDDYGIDHLVGDALGFADALGAERFHLVGHDWGAIISWHVAARAPERLRSLSIVSVPHPSAMRAAVADPTSGQAEKSSYIPMLRAEGSAELFTANDGAGLRGLFASAGLTGDVIDAHLEVLLEPGAMDAACNYYRAFDFREASLPPIEVPTLFVWSDDDVAIARAGADRTGEHVTGPFRYEVLEGVSHWVPEAAPEALTGFLLEHLASV